MSGLLHTGLAGLAHVNAPFDLVDMELKTCPFSAQIFRNLLHTRPKSELIKGHFFSSCKRPLSLNIYLALSGAAFPFP